MVRGQGSGLAGKKVGHKRPHGALPNMKLVLACSLALFTVLPHRPADACTPPPEFGGRDLSAIDGRLDVPLNARVVLAYYGRLFEVGTPEDVGVEVRAQGGASIPLTVTRSAGGISRHVITARPASPLAADTVYEVLDRFPST